MEVMATGIEGVKLLTPRKFHDHRGFFSETYNQRRMEEAGIFLDFVQDNSSLSTAAGTVRGLHFQIAPRSQTKLIRVVGGAVFDVAVDLRRGSQSFGKHFSTVLSAENGRQILIPPGFAHGFVTLEPNSVVAYKITDFHAPEHERGLLWNDPALGIDWPVDPAAVVLSDKDRDLPPLRDLSTLFD